MAPAPATIPEELLEEIFLRLPTPDALAWASAACTSFRCVIKGRAFRSRFRALHQPPLLGFIDKAGFHPAEAPHPSVPLAHALAPCAADYSFVPPPVVPELLLDYDEWAGPRWRPRDVRDGRVLLDWISLHPRVINYADNHSDVGILMDSNEIPYLMDPVPLLTWNKRARCNAADFHLAVCDPLSCGYVLLPTIPEDLAAQTQELLSEFQPVLAPATADADAEDQSFKVICIARYETKLALFVFLSTTRQWCIATYPIFILTPPGTLSCFDCVRGCFYWTEPWVWSDHLMVLDTRTMRFSTVNLLTGYHVQLRDLPDQSIVHGRKIAVVVGREGALEMFSLICQHGSFALHHTTLQNNSQEWQLEKIIQLSGQYHGYSISTVGAAEGFLFFQGTPENLLCQNVDCYSMEVKTYEITKVCAKMENFNNPKRALPYFSFPPLLWEPTI